MENEMSTSISITVELIVISVVMTVIMLFVGLGTTFSRHVTEQVADAEKASYGTELVSAGDYGAIPASALFTIIQKNSDSVGAITGSAYGINVTTMNDLAYLFAKKVRVTVVFANDLYNLVVAPE
jgi:hypothetical protein